MTLAGLGTTIISVPPGSPVEASVPTRGMGVHPYKFRRLRSFKSPEPKVGTVEVEPGVRWVDFLLTLVDLITLRVRAGVLGRGRVRRGLGEVRRSYTSYSSTYGTTSFGRQGS